MKGKVAIITGGSSGLGLAMAKKLAKEGSHVVITGRDLEKLEKAKEAIEQFEGQVFTIQMDVRQPELVQQMVDKTKEKFGKIDFLINNAAGNFLVKAEDLSVNGWNSVINIVLNGTWYCSQAVAKEWIDSGTNGSILNIVAAYAWTGGPGVVHSASAKAGVLAMSKTLAVEWGRRYGIRVNCIAPGCIKETGAADRLWPNEEAYQRTVNAIPLGRLGRPEEVANLAYFLLSPEAEYINGDCVTLDAGAQLAQNLF